MKLFWGTHNNREGWWLHGGESYIPIYGPSICKTSGGGSAIALKIAEVMGFEVDEVYSPYHMDIYGDICQC